jgi:hypothetical protein
MKTIENTSQKGVNTPVVMCSFDKIESNHHSIYIQKFSCTSSSCDFQDLQDLDLPSKVGLNNGYSNIWRVKIGRKSKWKHYSSLQKVMRYLSENCT